MDANEKYRRVWERWQQLRSKRIALFDDWFALVNKCKGKVPKSERQRVWQEDDETVAQIRKMEEKLCKMAGDVKPKPQNDYWCRADHSHVSTYHTQYWGADKYARGALLPMKTRLEELGFSTHISRVGREEYLREYILWANITPWEADAVRRCITIRFAAEVMKSHCVHPAVYFPTVKDKCVQTPWSG